MITAIADTIADQIGARAFSMMGTNAKLSDGKSLVFNIKGCQRWNKCRVDLAGDDTYTVTFYKVRGASVTKGEPIECIYFDMLLHCIESNTGLGLSL